MSGNLSKKISLILLNKVIIKCIGGEGASTAVLAPNIAPLGVNSRMVNDQIAKETMDYKGLPVFAEITIENRQFKLNFSYPSSCHIMKALNEPYRDLKHDGNITIEKVFEIARQMRTKSQAKKFSGTVKEILGTCLSIGCTVDGQSPRDITSKITSCEISCPDE